VLAGGDYGQKDNDQTQHEGFIFGDKITPTIALIFLYFTVVFYANNTAFMWKFDLKILISINGDFLARIFKSVLVVDEPEINMLGPFVNFCISTRTELKAKSKIKKKIITKKSKSLANQETTIFI
jgi:hypothetical protein